MKRVTGCSYENGSDIPTLLLVDDADIDNINKSNPYERIDCASYLYEIVKHAHWICMSDCGVTKCSHCGWNIEECVGYKRCPECGAYMDEIKESR